jgi:hypothetical protein
MRRLLSLTFVSLLLLPAFSSSAAPASSRYTALFCPECWTYLYGQGSTDMKGNCAACGKYPLELEVQTMKWFWCADKHRWLQEPCAQHSHRNHCLPAESMALVAKPGPDLGRAAYCPLHQSFTAVRLPLVGVKVCAQCSRPMVSAWATRRTWFWCEHEGYWAASACPENPVLHCCTKRQGLLLATPEPGPLAEQ